jgi:hypothetical protein
MSVARQANILGQQRVDVPHIRAIESSVAADFDLLAGQIMAGKNPLVISGFKLISVSAGTPTSSLQIEVAGSVILHPEASENGTIFQVPADRAPETLNAANARVQGGFTASAVNYIGIDLRRSADSTTADLVQFLDPNTNLEKPKTVPLGRTLDYFIVISTQDFSSTPGVAPLAKVTTDAFNNVASVSAAIEDARNFQFRLGTGGTVTNAKNAYTWPGGRGETGLNTDFAVGDKVITSFKEWMDSVMTRLWELGGGEFWYSATADRNVKLVRTGSTFTNGDWFEWDSTNLHWKNLTIVFDNSTGTYNDVKDQLTDSSGLTNLADGECIYVDLDRTQNRTGGSALQPVKAQLTTLSYPTIPGSRMVLAWRKGSGSQCIMTRDAQFPVNASFVVATTVSAGVVQLDATATLSGSNPLVYTSGSRNIANKIAGLDGTRQVIGTGLQRDTVGVMDIGTNTNTTTINIGTNTAGSTTAINIGSTGGTGSLSIALQAAAGYVYVTGLPSSTAINSYGASAFEVYEPGAGATTDGYLQRWFRAGPQQVAGITNRGGLILRDVKTVSGGSEPGNLPASSNSAMLYIRRNGLSTPNTRQQLVIKWQDNTISVIAESPAF